MQIENAADRITKQAKPKYREIIEKLPEFEKADRFTPYFYLNIRFIFFS